MVEKVQLFDRETGLPAFELEMPDGMREKAAEVEAWMRQNFVSKFGALVIPSNHDGTPLRCPNCGHTP